MGEGLSVHHKLNMEFTQTVLAIWSGIIFLILEQNPGFCAFESLFQDSMHLEVKTPTFTVQSILAILD